MARELRARGAGTERWAAWQGRGAEIAPTVSEKAVGHKVPADAARCLARTGDDLDEPPLLPYPKGEHLE